MSDSFIQSERFKDMIRQWMNDWVLCSWDLLKIELDPWQQRALRDLQDYNTVVVHSAHGVGKTFFDAVSTLIFLFLHPMSKIVTTAPNFDRQVRAGLWAEIHRLYRRSEILQELFRMDTVSIRHRDYREEWFGMGFSVELSSKESEAKTLEGFHAPALLAVLDEAKGIPDSIYKSIKGALTGNQAKLLVTSTPPLDPIGFFVDMVQSNNSKVKVHSVSAYSSPRVSLEWIEDRRLEWGEDSAVFKAKVLGEIPEGGERSFFPSGIIKRGIENRTALSGDCTLGVDVARYGTNYSAVSSRRGNRIMKVVRAPIHLDTMALVGLIVKYIYEEQPTFVNIDATGVGAGVVDRLKEVVVEKRSSTIWRDNIFSSVQVRGVELGSSSQSKEKYKNLRAELYDKLRMGLTSDILAIPNDPTLVDEMYGIGYTYDSLGRLVIESKESMERRGKPSPDTLDAVILSLYEVNDRPWVPLSAGAIDWITR